MIIKTNNSRDVTVTILMTARTLIPLLLKLP